MDGKAALDNPAWVFDVWFYVSYDKEGVAFGHPLLD